MSYWALYKGEEVIAHGTKLEISEQTGISLETITWTATPSARKRYVEGSDRQVMVEVKLD